MRLYKGKYLIGIYAPLEEGETLLALCSNTREFMKLLNINETRAKNALSLLFARKHHFIRFNGKICSVEFILPLDED